MYTGFISHHVTRPDPPLACEHGAQSSPGTFLGGLLEGVDVAAASLAVVDDGARVLLELGLLHRDRLLDVFVHGKLRSLLVRCQLLVVRLKKNNGVFNLQRLMYYLGCYKRKGDTQSKLYIAMKNHIPDNDIPDNDIPDNDILDNHIPDNHIPDNYHY